jgi:hypothetical protein
MATETRQQNKSDSNNKQQNQIYNTIESSFYCHGSFIGILTTEHRYSDRTKNDFEYKDLVALGT